MARVTGITIPIDGDTRPLGKALKEVNKESRGVYKELREVERALKFNPHSVELISQKQRLLTDQVGKTSEKLKILKDNQDEVNRAFQAGEITEEQYRAYQREIETTTSKLKHFDEQLKETARQNNALGQNLQEIGGKFQEVGGKIKETGGKITKSISGPAAAVGGLGVKMAMDFEKGMGKIFTLADKNVVSQDKMEEAVKRLSKTYGIETASIQESIYNALSSGQDTAEVLQFVESNIKLAEGGFTSLETAIDATTSVMNAYGAESYNLEKIQDIFINTQNEGKISVDQLGQEIGKVIPIASSLGVNVDQLGAAYALLTKNGVPVNQSTTMIKSTLAELSKTGSNADQALRELSGKSFKELIDEGNSVSDVLAMLDKHAQANGLSLKDMFGNVNAGSGALALLSGDADEFNQLLGIMNDNLGVTDENYQETDSTARQMAKTMESLKSNLLELGEVLLPVADSIANSIEKVSDKIGEMDEGTLEMIGKAVMLAIALGPVVTIIGTIISVIGGIVSLVGGVLLPIISFVISAIGGVIGILFQLNPIVLAIMAVIGALTMIIHGLGSSWKEVFNAIWGKTKEVFGGIGDWLSELGGRISKIPSKVGGIVSSMVSTVTGKISEMKSKVADIFKSMGNSLKNAFKVKIKLPKFKMTGSFGLNPPRVPKVGINWHAKGGIFTQPTLFNTPNGVHGVGEAGPEAILPLEKLPKLLGMDKTSDNKNIYSKSDVNIHITGEGSQYLSNSRIARQVEQQLANKIARDNRSLSSRPKRISI